ncbi:MAG: c-type cytochrome [Methylohalobius crimeensis]
MKTILTLICAMGLIAASSIQAAEDKTAVCAGCHGEAGKGATPLFPKLAGQNAKYLETQLHYFKNQTRVIPAMNAVTASLSDADIAELSAYFARQTPSPEASEASPQGERIYRAGIAAKKVPACAACHGPDGEGNAPAGFPLLKGQYAAYTVKALSDSAAGNRGDKTPMADIAARMSEDEMKAVAAYIAGLK